VVISLRHRAGEPVPVDIDGISYTLAVPSVLGAVQWRRAIVALGGRQVGPLALMLKLREAVINSLLPEAEHAAQRAEWLALVDAQVARVRAMLDAARNASRDAEGFGQALFAVEAGEDAALRAIAAAARQLDAGYADAMADAEVFWDLAGIAGARMFLMGWSRIEGEGDPLPPLRRTRAGLEEAALAEIPQHHLAPLGLAIDRLTRPDEAARKN
jgi:hypothetical protein